MKNKTLSIQEKEINFENKLNMNGMNVDNEVNMIEQEEDIKPRVFEKQYT